VYFDVPNGGVKKEYMNLSPGSILMWLNVNNAKSYCHKHSPLMTCLCWMYQLKSCRLPSRS
ncbi:hypothetical protein ACFEOY_004413, partial [Salmonella enterica]